MYLFYLLLVYILYILTDYKVMEDINAEIMQAGLHRLWTKRQGLILSPMHEIRDEILDQGQYASFNNQVSC